MLTVGTWNVHTMGAPGKLELLENEMERYRFDILGLAEMRWTASGEMHGCKVIWSGNEQKLDKPSRQSANDVPNRKTEVTDRRTHGGRTSRISQRQEYSTADPTAITMTK